MSSAKSYIYSGDGKAEFERLEVQAKLIFDEEFSVLRSFSLQDGHCFLDAGCGPGFLTKYIASKLNKAKIIGIDSNPDLLKLANSNTSHLHNVEIISSDIYKTPIKENSIDFIYSRLVYSHLSQPLSAMTEFKRILKTGGTVAILDIDDGLLSCFPEFLPFNQLIDEAMAVQSIAKGDRLVGRKLGSYLTESGFSDIQVMIRTFVLNGAGSVPLFRILVGGRIDYISKEKRVFFEKAISELESRIATGRNWIYLPVIIAKGVKP